MSTREAQGEVPWQGDEALQRLKEYYAEHNVNLDSLCSTTTQAGATSRFIRLNPRFDKEETIRIIKSDLSSPTNKSYPKKVLWLDSIIDSNCSADLLEFFAVPAEFRLAQSEAYKAGRIYGQDVSSGAAVATLMDPPPFPTTTSKTPPNAASAAAPLRILDLCCAPGLKLCAIADWLEQNHTMLGSASATVVGVDISESRLDVTRNVIYKYLIKPETRGDNGRSCSLPRLRLYQGDGTTFGQDQSNDDNLHNLVFDSLAAIEEDKGERKRTNKSSRARERKRLKMLQDNDVKLVPGTCELFDRVLVDAECSTDGSLKHVQKILQGSSSSHTNGGMLPLLFDPEKMEELLDLQKRLAFQGFRVLKPGGYMVYSTCSLSKRQNEDIVEKLLESFADATLVPISIDGLEDSKLVAEGSIEGTIRFLPNTGSNEFYGGGFFLARVKKEHRRF